MDNLNDDFKQSGIKYARLQELRKHPEFIFSHIDICSTIDVDNQFYGENFDAVYHLAAQAGVKQSTDRPDLFTKSNLTGFAIILEACRQYKIPHLIFASSSSVYGDKDWACTEDMDTNSPKSYYAATKKANEAMASSYSNLYGMRITGCRFFTVYGPWGRPDMATWKFTEAILNKTPVTLYQAGKLSRDFTYIDDAVDILLKFIEPVGQRPHLNNLNRFQIFNVGTCKPIKVSTYVRILEDVIGTKAIINNAPVDKSEVQHTFCNMLKYRQYYSNEIQHTDIKVGLSNFVKWYKNYTQI